MLVIISGLLYNVGLSATPPFEGRLVQCLADILGGSKTFGATATLVVCYIAVIFAAGGEVFIIARRHRGRGDVTFGIIGKEILKPRYKPIIGVK